MLLSSSSGCNSTGSRLAARHHSAAHQLAAEASIVEQCGAGLHPAADFQSAHSALASTHGTPMKSACRMHYCPTMLLLLLASTAFAAQNMIEYLTPRRAR